ncbi:MAG: hypothetical protein Q8K30_07055 [Candidatus Gracilibacteria bacterium]|nr:hypothetical protein [Candidatus Gracilibacteria bacterium]
MLVKAGVLDRIEQSFGIIKSNFLDFFIPFFVYNFISFLVIWVAVFSFGLGVIGGLDTTSIDPFVILNNPKVVILISVGMITMIIYLLLYIPILLGLIKSIKQAINGEDITTKDNIIYGFKNLTNSFKTYWYIFAYVALIPSIIFILGGIMFNASYFLGAPENLKIIGGVFMGISVVLFLAYSIYRGYRASFSIYSAVDNDSFTKDDFIKTLSFTDNKWWRIFGNFLLLGLIIGLLTSLIGGIFSAISLSNKIDTDSIKTIEDIKLLASNFSIVTQSLSGFVNTIISTIGKIFVIIFTYLFYLRLKQESMGALEIEHLSEAVQKPVNNEENKKEL